MSRGLEKRLGLALEVKSLVVEELVLRTGATKIEKELTCLDLHFRFVQEAWMTPSLFDCATGGKSAEYDVLDGFGQSPDGVANATSYMQRHWDTFIVEDDFKRMADMGINTVRLPIGYWSVGPYFTRDSPFQAYQQVYELSWRYVARAINWAAKYDIGVLVE